MPPSSSLCFYMLSLKAFLRELLLIMYIVLLWSCIKNAVTTSEKLWSDQVVRLVLRTFGLGFFCQAKLCCAFICHSLYFWELTAEFGIVDAVDLHIKKKAKLKVNFICNFGFWASFSNFKRSRMKIMFVYISFESCSSHLFKINL